MGKPTMLLCNCEEMTNTKKSAYDRADSMGLTKGKEHFDQVYQHIKQKIFATLHKQKVTKENFCISKCPFCQRIVTKKFARMIKKRVLPKVVYNSDQKIFKPILTNEIKKIEELSEKLTLNPDAKEENSMEAKAIDDV